jgi:tripartite-type tricarboxylate transporter receptor subunit TctC
VRILVGAPAGGTTDTMARALAQEMGKALGRTVVVENRPGAGGNIAAEAVARAAPDGTTLLMSFTSHAINASLYPSLPFDPEKDFTPLTQVSSSTAMLVAHPSLPARDLRELVALAKAKPGRLNFAIGSVGSSIHLAGDAFKMMANVYIVNIPYRGTAPAVQDVLAGPGRDDVRQRRQRAGARARRQAQGAGRHQRPAAAGVPGRARHRRGAARLRVERLVRPVRPGAHGARSGQAAQRRGAAGDRHARGARRIEIEGATPIGNSPQEFAAFVHAEIPRWARVVKYSGAKPD